MSNPNATHGATLGAASLSNYIASSLPKDAEPQLKTPTDAVAIACHAGMLAVGFTLVGLGEDHQIEAHSEQQSTQPLPSEWSASSAHAFRYTHLQSSMQFLLKVSRLGNKTVIYGIGMGDDKTTSFDITTKDFISESALPSSPAKPSISTDDAAHAIHAIFISPSRLTDLGSLLRLNIIQKLVPSLQKEGYEETPLSTSTTADDRGQQRRDPPLHPAPQYDPLRDDPLLPRPAQPHPLLDPSVGPRRPPVPAGDFPPPGFEDEYEMNRPPRGWRPAGNGRGPPRIGDQDLYPPGMGPNDPLRMGPGRRGGGGMHPTFDDLNNPYGDSDAFGDMQVPPGARFDPPGPGRAPRGGGMGGPFGGGGAGFGGFGGGDII